MALGLLLERLAKPLKQLVQVERFELRPVLVADVGRDRVFEPVEDLVGDVNVVLDVVKKRSEGPIVDVLVRFALHQQAPGQVVKRV